ncbi:MAG: sulfatase-like hydrolase/transferase, partial [Planctomycetota bacterium JB042]
MNKTRFVLTLWAGVGSVAAAGAANPPNVLIVVADDLSAYDVARYGVSSDPVHMPVLDRLADRGVTFTNAWSNPVCSPTRACIQTGRHAFRTGVGFLVLPNTKALDPSEWILPELLGQATPQSYRSGAFGKWHLGNQTVGGFSAPNRAGYDVFAGNMTSLVDNQETYSAWMKVTNGSPKPAQKYNTTDIVDDAIRWLSSAPEPWFCYVAFNAPHVPLHAPPAHLHSVDLTTAPPPAFAPRPYFKAMVEAMDTEMGRLVASLGDRVDHTNIVFIGDNGSPKEAVVPPVLPHQAKISFYEAGIRVPLVVAGPAVRVKGSASDALVHAVDVFPTVAEMAGVDPAAVLPPGT